MSNVLVSTQDYDTSALDAIFDKVMEPVQSSPSTTSRAMESDVTDKILDTGKIPDPIVHTEDKTPAISDQQAMDIIDKAAEQLNVQADNTEQKPDDTAGGRPKTDKDAFIEYMKSKIEAREFGVPEDYDTSIPVEDYLKKQSVKTLYDLLDSNWKVKEEDIRNTAPREFYEALPDAVKDVAEYAQQGGTDWLNFFKAKSIVEETRKLDPAKEEDHIPIIRNYLQETTKFTPTQISDQIEEWKETGKLDKKALEFKAPLDNIQELKKQAFQKQAQEQQQRDTEVANFYMQHVTQVLAKNELAGIKLDRKFTGDMYEGLLGTAPGPFSGRPVNLLGALIEHKSFIEPDYESLAMATWLLQDKEGFLKAVGQRGANEEANNAIKLIKLEQGIKAPNTQTTVVAKQDTVKRLPNMKNVLRRQPI